VLGVVAAHPDARVVLLDLEATSQLDTTSVDALDLVLSRLRERDVELHLVRVFRSAREVLRRSGFTERLGPDRMWHSISAAVRAARQQLEAAGVAQEPLDDGDSLDDYSPGEERIAPQQADQDQPELPDLVDDIALTGDDTTAAGRTVEAAVVERTKKKRNKNGKNHHSSG
jgi:hypothetical protein